MQVEILRCPACGRYTLNPQCSCGKEALRIIPAKYSPEDKYGEYRRKAKEELAQNPEVASLTAGSK